MTYLDWNTATNRLQRRQRDDLLDGVDSQAGSSKPTTRSDGSTLQTGDRWLDATNRIWFYWNGTYWLSEETFFASIAESSLLATTANAILIPIPGFNLLLVSLYCAAVLTAPVNSSNYWRLTIEDVDSLKPPTYTTRATRTFNTTTLTGTESIASVLTGSLNSHLDLVNLDVQMLRAVWTKVGMPGVLTQSVATLRYRLAKA